LLKEVFSLLSRYFAKPLGPEFQRLIIFKKGKDNYEFPVKDFIGFFFITANIIQTFNFALINVHLFEIIEGNEDVIEFFKRDFKKSIAPYLPDLVKQNNNKREDFH